MISGQMYTLDLLIFDLDGTLIDSKADIATALNLTLQEIGLPPKPPEMIAKFIGGGVGRLLEQAMDSESDHESDQLIDDIIPTFRKHYLDHLLDETTLFPDVLETLEFFRDKQLAIATNKPMVYTERILKGLGIDGYFQMVLGGDSIDTRKPRPEMLLKTMEMLRVEKNRTLMIGDGLNDILAAKAAGVACCVVTYGLTEPSVLLEAQPDHVCHSLREIRGICP